MARVLIVDDELSGLRFSRRAVKELRHETLVASSPDIALQLVRSNPDIAAIISDVRMKGGGIQTILNAGLEIPVIAVSGAFTKAGGESVEGLIRLGAFAAIKKGNVDSLTAAITAALASAKP